MPPKRPALSCSHAQNKYPRQETVAAAAKTTAINNVSGPTEEESDISEEMKAKLARKEARVSFTFFMSSHEQVLRVYEGQVDVWNYPLALSRCLLKKLKIQRLLK